MAGAYFTRVRRLDIALFGGEELCGCYSPDSDAVVIGSLTDRWPRIEFVTGVAFSLNRALQVGKLRVSIRK